MDWDQDGKLDILSGCYWTEGAEAGHIQLLKGKGDLNFEEAVPLENMAGKPLENTEPDGSEQNQMLNICTQQHAVDYDGDGDLDLVVGCFGTKFFLYENKADEENGEQSLVEEAIELPVESIALHSAPHLVDWDNDGDLDLLSGSSEGGALISENKGTRKEPQWTAFKQLLPPSTQHEQSISDGTRIEMSRSTRVWATDWNGDGLLDLLVGDSANILKAKPGISAAKFEKLRSAYEKKMASIVKQQQALMPEYKAAIESGEELTEELKARIEKIGEEFMEVYKGADQFQTSKNTGFVWLLIRKPTTAFVSTEVSSPDSP